MEPTKEQLIEWWETKESRWQTALALAGPKISHGSTGYCIRGGTGGPFCLHLEDHGAGLFGEAVIAVTWGGYMHVDCAIQSLREIEAAGHVYETSTYDPLVIRVETRSDAAGMTDALGTIAMDPVSIEPDESDSSGMRIEGAQLEEVLQHGTQAEIITLLNQYAGQPIIVVSRATGRSRLDRGIYRYFAWKVVE